MKNNWLVWIVINLLFDFDISLFVLSMWITITSYLDSSHVSIEFQCIHTFMSQLNCLVWRTKVGIRTGRRWMYSRKHTHTTPTHVNRQTDKECAWGRPRLLQTVFKMLFVGSFVKCHERATAWLFHVGASQNYCVSHLISCRNNGGEGSEADQLLAQFGTNI